MKDLWCKKAVWLVHLFMREKLTQVLEESKKGGGLEELGPGDSLNSPRTWEPTAGVLPSMMEKIDI